MSTSLCALTPTILARQLLRAGPNLEELLEYFFEDAHTIAKLLYSQEFKDHLQLRVDLAAAQAKLQAATLLPACMTKLHELTQTEKPEVARRATTALMAIAGISTQVRPTPPNIPPAPPSSPSAGPRYEPDLPPERPEPQTPASHHPHNDSINQIEPDTAAPKASHNPTPNNPHNSDNHPNNATSNSNHAAPARRKITHRQGQAIGQLHMNDILDCHFTLYTQGIDLLNITRQNFTGFTDYLRAFFQPAGITLSKTTFDDPQALARAHAFFNPTPPNPRPADPKINQNPSNSALLPPSPPLENPPAKMEAPALH